MRFALLLLVWMSTTGFAGAEPQAPASADEIQYLISYIQNSGARFIRNGTEYSAQEGADHMRDKLSRSGGRVKTAEDFIKGIASQSYLSGQPYKVRLKDGRILETGPWLTQALREHRSKFTPKDVSGTTGASHST